MPSVCLDAGHGGKDAGATLGSRYEKNDVLKMVLKVGPILEKAGIKVYYTRKSDFYESPTAKANKANKYGADFFASFHRNAANKAAKGYETLVYSNSGKAKKCADSANSAMKSIGFVNRGTKIRKELAVLNTTRMDAVLFEIGFIDNVVDNDLFDKNFDKIANGLATAIATALGVKIKPTATTTVKPVATKKKAQQVAGTAVNNLGLKYHAHVADLGTLAPVHDGQVAGTTGFGVRMEALWIDVDALKKVPGYEKVAIDVKAHLQGIGDKLYKNIKSDTMIGTTGQARRLEGLLISARNLPKGKSLKFQVHEANKGWSSVAIADANGAFRGSIGEARQMEAVKIWIE